MFEYSCVLGPGLNISSRLPGPRSNISQERKNVSSIKAHKRRIQRFYNQIVQVKFPFLGFFFSSYSVPECSKRDTDSDSHSWVKIWISVQVNYFNKTVIVLEFLTLNVVMSCVCVMVVLQKSYNVLNWFILQVNMDQHWRCVYFILMLTDFLCQYRCFTHQGTSGSWQHSAEHVSFHLPNWTENSLVNDHIYWCNSIHTNSIF